MKKILFILFIFISAAVLGLSLRGVPGNPSHETINSSTWKDEGPLELSPERGRFALTYSIIEDKSMHFTLPIARFATPDLGYSNGKYVSLFAPGVSYITAPGFLIGKYFNASQVGSYAVIAVFALLNAVLIRAIALRLGANTASATIAGLLFLFATPAFAYAVSLYQHHISTFLILAGIYILLRFKSVWSLAAIWFLCAASIPIDYPNLFLMFPIGIYALGRMIFVENKGNAFNLKIKLLGFLTFMTMIIPLSFFMYFNTVSYGNPFQFSGTVATVKTIDEAGNPAAPDEIGDQDPSTLQKPETQDKSAVAFFKSRNLTNGFYTHFISPDRGILWFTPVIFLSIGGMYFLNKKYPSVLALLLGVMGANILLYSMWGDPWGGWAFGSRYLIPSYAIAAILISFLLTAWNRKIVFLLLFQTLFIYSVYVNTLGAITSSRNPPKVEILNLEKLTGRVERYTYARNFESLVENNSKSFVFQIWANRYVHATQYYLVIVGLVIVFASGLVLYVYKDTVMYYDKH